MNTIYTASISIIVAALILVSSQRYLALANDSVALFECKAKVQDVGREEGSLNSPLMRWPDGRLRLIDKGGRAYLHEPKGTVRSAWIELFAVPRGHGDTLLGSFQTKHFTCESVEE